MINKGYFKVRVKKNIGKESEKVFGKVGTIFRIKEGIFFDLDGYEWSNDGKGFATVKDINKQLNQPQNEYFQTEFESIEEEKSPKDYLIDGCVVILNDGWKGYYCNGMAFSENQWMTMTISDYNEKLEHEDNRFSISTIYIPIKGSLSYMFNNIDEIIWEKNPKKQMTKEEAEKEFNIIITN